MTFNTTHPITLLLHIITPPSFYMGNPPFELTTFRQIIDFNNDKHANHTTGGNSTTTISRTNSRSPETSSFYSLHPELFNTVFENQTNSFICRSYHYQHQSPLTEPLCLVLWQSPPLYAQIKSHKTVYRYLLFPLLVRLSFAFGVFHCPIIVYVSSWCSWSSFFFLFFLCAHWVFLWVIPFSSSHIGFFF